MKSLLSRTWLLALLLAVMAVAGTAAAGEETSAATGDESSRESAAAMLARKVANPLASLVSVPFQFNSEDGIGPFDLRRSTLNVQPVIPLSPGDHPGVRLITRTIIPIVDQDAGPVGRGVSGIGDITASLFVTRTTPSRRGWMLGAGPVMQLPTGSDDALTTNRWSIGPTAVAVRQAGSWTWGMLANHLWSVTDGGGEGAGGAVNATFAQPFVNYITPAHTTFVLNTEATRDWERDSWAVPVHVMVNQLLKVGPQPMSVFVGARYWAASPDGGPEGWGLRAGTTLLFPAGR